MEADRRPAAMLFPGMAPTRFADLGRFLLTNPIARDMVATADERLGWPVLERFRAADGDYSAAGQVAFLLSCLACASWAERELGIETTFCAGASFGGKAAAVHSGALDLADAIWMTAGLARCMEEYFAAEHRDVVIHSFVRIGAGTLAEITAELAARGEWSEVACHVDTEMYMLCLREHNLEWLERRVRAAGGLSLYTMRPPLHSPAFEGLRRLAAEQVLDRITFADPARPVISDRDGAVLSLGDEIRTLLLDSIVAPLDWPAVVASLRAQGVRRVCVAGPDSLFGRVRVTTEAFEVIAASPVAALRPRRARAGRPAA
ncbi:ACP S-malonyltransferase [Actinoplanes sp. NPDC051343]|jgi:[acyl-carrier-protein] S-malonyltransferase|uniref:ACP S-malonyltransferase n=1 Tax=Actinoplanes sp. NPDC051343 TaxID=3363906 RepID=UPI00379E4A95